MALRVASFDPTPNPNAVKCVLDGDGPDRPRSYFNASMAAGDPLAEALFAIEGVTTVLIHTAFITVNKTPEADWKPIRTGVEAALADHDA